MTHTVVRGRATEKLGLSQAHVRRYMNEGHDVQNTQEYKTAILSNEGADLTATFLLVISSVFPKKPPRSQGSI